MRSKTAASVERVILSVRGQRVILSPDLAEIYGVEPRALNQAVRRNANRFPADFVFRLTRDETKGVQRLRSQIVILKRGTHQKYAPLAFTEHGAIMAATVLNSPRAVEMSVFVVRAFLRLRQWVTEQAQLSARLSQLERRMGRRDRDVKHILQAIRQLIEPPPEAPEPVRPRIGFVAVVPAGRRLRAGRA